MRDVAYTVGLLAIGFLVGFLFAVDVVGPRPYYQIVDGGMVTCRP